jgi:hypothetical protein
MIELRFYGYLARNHVNSSEMADLSICISGLTEREMAEPLIYIVLDMVG